MLKVVSRRAEQKRMFEAMAVKIEARATGKRFNMKKFIYFDTFTALKKYWLLSHTINYIWVDSLQAPNHFGSAHVVLETQFLGLSQSSFAPHRNNFHGVQESGLKNP